MDYLEDFNYLRTRVFEVCGLEFSLPKKESESSEYHACLFEINNRSVVYRKAKVTPTKNGQFVTIWKRTGVQPIQPYDVLDNISLFVVAVKNEKRMGLFIFTQKVLIEQGVLSVCERGGKRAMRVYPPWVKTESKQAEKTQKWQLEFFAEIPKDSLIDTERFKCLFLAPDFQFVAGP